MFRVPRNLPFIERLPPRFTLKVLKKRNQTAEGKWYLVEVHQHRLNLLSESELIEGESLEIEKQGALLLKVIRSMGKNSVSSNSRELPSPHGKFVNISG